MKPLEKILRDQLERTVRDARDIAETARARIKWGKDRGEDVESAPWYYLFKGERINDYHLSLAEKHAARKNSKSIHVGGK